MNWRAIITFLLLVGALISGWSVWNQRAKDAAPTGLVGRADYVLEDFELIAKLAKLLPVIRMAEQMREMTAELRADVAAKRVCRSAKT